VCRGGTSGEPANLPTRAELSVRVPRSSSYLPTQNAEGPPFGMLPPTGKRMDAPCCDVFKLADGKLQRFDCYPEGSVILSQLGVLGNLDAVLQPHVTV
jgi:hypothetical protein